MAVQERLLLSVAGTLATSWPPLAPLLALADPFPIPAGPCWPRPGQVLHLRPSVDLAAIVEKMEIIDAADVSLVRFLGSGG